MSNGAEAREATLEAVHSDQLGMQDQLRDLGNILTRIEEHLMGGPHVHMAGAVSAQVQAQGLGGGPAGAPLQPMEQPRMPGMLPQMCELGLNNSHLVSDMQSRLAHVSRLLGVPNT